MTITDNECCHEQMEIADQLLSLIRPHYKGLKGPGSAPEFKKSMSGNEVEELLTSLHGIVVGIRQRLGNTSNGS